MARTQFNSMGDIRASDLADVLGYTPGDAATLVTQGTAIAQNATDIVATNSTVAGMQTAINNILSSNPSFYTPTTGSTLNLVSSGLNKIHVVNPAGALATLTLTMNNGTQDGQTAFVVFGKAITLATWSGTNISVAIPFVTTILTIPSCVGVCWDSASQKWVRFI